MVEVKIRQIKGASPLRYPGGKSALTGFLGTLIEELQLSGTTYVEPYAGGAGAALALLDAGIASRIVINDFDPAIYSFWRAAVEHNDEFLQKFDATEVTLKEWRRQKEIYAANRVQNFMELGFAAYFLNRTNRSGVLNAGVIGGQKQDGNYKINARFNKTALRPRLESIDLLKDSIEVTNLDGRACIKEYIERPNTFIYADPPYFDKGSFLYMNAFARRDHVDLADLLKSHTSRNWLLSYDNAKEIVGMYEGLFQKTLALNYSAHRTGLATELLVASEPVAALLTES